MARLSVLPMLMLFVTHLNGQGIHFESSLNWSDLKEKARNEKKYIFVDCYASWCGPCRDMDKAVYSDAKVAQFFNDRFVSVKIQMDTTRDDNEQIQAWYEEGHRMIVEYSVGVYPTFLFFSPDGHIVHRGMGFQNPDDLISLATNATDSNKQYYTLIQKYREGGRDFAVLRYLAETSLMMGDKSLAHTIAEDYISGYLMRSDSLITKRSIEFIVSFIQHSADAGFGFFYTRSDRIDSVMQKGYSQAVVDFIIAKECIDPNLWRNSDPSQPITQTPNWSKIKRIVRMKYGVVYADRTVIDAQVRWYGFKNDWKKLAKYSFKKIDRYGLDTAGVGRGVINNLNWEVVFLHINDRKTINKAIEVQKILVTHWSNDASELDTYANLLYKAGRTQEALSWERKAIVLSPDNKDIQVSYKKMQKGEPTWTNLL